MTMFLARLAAASALFIGINARTQVTPGQTGQAEPNPNSSSQQTGNYATPTLRLSTRIVVLDVTVTDRKGNLVPRELTRDDFTIVEDGQPQRIRSFDPPSKHTMPQSAVAVVNSAADLVKIGDAPVTILVLDELNSRFEDMSFSRQMMLKYLQSQPPVLRQPTVLMIAMNTSFKQVHDYTQSRDELIDVVKKHSPEYPWRMMNSGKSSPGAVERMAQVLAALQQIAQSSTGTPGRKNLVWVGNGFPSAGLAGLDQRTSDLIEAAVRRCTARLLAARVTMYTINPAAGTSSTLDVETPDDLDSALDATGGDPFASGTVSFSNLAPSTGGIAYTGRNDLNNVIGEGISKGNSYYTMSYSPSNSSEDAAKFRNIRIVMKDPNLHATTRNGYFPESKADLNPVADKSMDSKQITANLKLDLSAALTTTISYNGLSVTAKKSSPSEFTIRVAERGITWSDPGPGGAQNAEATVAAGWYGPKNKLLGHVVREETFARPSTGDGATFTLPVTLPPGVQRLRIVVRDALSGTMGTIDLTTF